MQTLILTQAQAEALYSAMCALNNVGGRLSQIDIGEQSSSPQARFTIAGSVIVERGMPHCDREVYDDQSAFATAYGLEDALILSATESPYGGFGCDGIADLAD